ncbi:MAG TPA: DNA polymerase III subunit gamma and tau [Candidatus Microbacterium pullistercoris]|nr:DNA polymerase III subunit gamma and tau [Candidatus Microbacterium pullistercoris]
MSTALYRRYRPEAFAEMIGQSQVTEPLMTALRTDRIGHAYLFSGPRGCGKTTSARILARCLNCAEGPTDIPCGTCESCVELSRDGGGSLDVVEIDAASHNGVDDARDLRERAVFAPARDRYKIFILDEAHMVSPQGFNALLKLVEEPPEHIKFIFATTEPEKVIGTIRSRTHHYPFRLVPPAAMLDYVEQLCGQESIAPDPGVLPLVVRAGAGSPRDTLSILDQLIAGSEEASVSYERAVALLGYTHGELLDEVVDAFASAQPSGAFAAVDRVVQTGQDPRRFVDDLLERMRDLIVIAATGDDAASVLRGRPADELARMQTQAAAYGTARLSRAADLVSAALDQMTGATSPRLQLELLVARVLTADGAVGEGPGSDASASRSDDAGPSSAPATETSPSGAGQDARAGTSPSRVEDPAPEPAPPAAAPPAATASAAPPSAPPAAAPSETTPAAAVAPPTAPPGAPSTERVTTAPAHPAGEASDAPDAPSASPGASSGTPVAPAAEPAATSDSGAAPVAPPATAAPTIETDPEPAAPPAAAQPTAAPVADAAASATVAPSGPPESDDVPAAAWATAAPGSAATELAPAVAEPAPVAPAALTLAALADAWPRILSAIEGVSRESWLVLQSATPAHVADDVVGLAFTNQTDLGRFKTRAPDGSGVSEDLRVAIDDVTGVRVKFLARHVPGAPAPADDALPPVDDAPPAEDGPPDDDPTGPATSSYAAAPGWAVAPIPGAETAEPALAAAPPPFAAASEPAASAATEEPAADSDATTGDAATSDAAPTSVEQAADSGPTVQSRQVRLDDGVQRYGEAVVRQKLGATFLHEEEFAPPTRFQ